MTTRYLLDTNALSQLIRDPRGSVANRIEAVGEPNVCTSIIVACELRYGARKKGEQVLVDRVEQLLASLDVLPLDPGVDRIYADVRCALESAGRPIGAMDLLIATHALEQSAVLVTDNTAEFNRIPALLVENWGRAPTPPP